MRLLLDTHALIWWLAGDDALGRRAREAVADGGNDVLVSAASAMEISTKHRLGKLARAALLAENFAAILSDQGFVEHPITIRHAQLAGGMAIPHKDPFDRLLIAQALADDLVLVSNEAVFDGFGVRRVW